MLVLVDGGCDVTKGRLTRVLISKLVAVSRE